jgi:hypothetical protein
MKTLYVEIDVETSGGEPDDPDAAWPTYSDKIHSISVNKGTFHRGNSFWPSDSIQVPGGFDQFEKLYLSIVRYSDGDTFGSSQGLHKICFVATTYQDAKRYDPLTMWTGHKFWQGYFGGYECTEVYKIDIVDSLEEEK